MSEPGKRQALFIIQAKVKHEVKDDLAMLDSVLWNAWEMAVRNGVALEFKYGNTNYLIDENSDIPALLEEAQNAIRKS